MNGTCPGCGKATQWRGRDVPIDILGGGLSVAPPTTNSKGQYRFIRGGLEDVRRLPTMRGLARESEEIVPPRRHHGCAEFSQRRENRITNRQGRKARYRTLGSLHAECAHIELVSSL